MAIASSCEIDNSGEACRFEQGEPTFALVFAREIFGCARGFFEGRPGQICLAHHVGSHAQVKLNLRIIGSFFRALLKNRQGLLIVAAFVKDPAKGIADRSVLPLQLTGLARQLVSLVEIIQMLGVEISEVI